EAPDGAFDHAGGVGGRVALGDHVRLQEGRHRLAAGSAGRRRLGAGFVRVDLVRWHALPPSMQAAEKTAACAPRWTAERPANPKIGGAGTRRTRGSSAAATAYTRRTMPRRSLPHGAPDAPVPHSAGAAGR